MDHDSSRERLHDYRDGELTSGEAASLCAHLAACAECRGELARWERFSRALRAPEPSAPESFLARVLARLPAEDPPQPWLVPALAFALAALALILAWPGGPSLPPAESLLLADAVEPAGEYSARGETLEILLEAP